MYFSVSSVLERKRNELYQIVNLNIPLTSEEALKLSRELDQCVIHYQNQNLSELDIYETLQGSTLTIKIKGQLDIVTSELLLSHIDLNKNKWTKIQELYIDMIELNFFDTSGIRSLILLLREARKNNISIKTIHTTKTAYKILELMGIPDALVRFDCGMLKKMK